jgi:hypothetical protein
MKPLLTAIVILGALATAHAGAPDLSVTPIAREGQVLVSFELSEGLTAAIRESIQSGLATTFSYDIQLRRAAATWVDRTLASLSVTATVRFDNLTRRYQISRSIDGRLEEARPTENREAVYRWMTCFERIPLSPTSKLEPNGEYYVRVRALTRPRDGWFFWPWDQGSVLGDAKFTFIP